MSNSNNFITSQTIPPQLFTNCRLIERILEAWEEDDIDKAQRRRCRRGYMGHLTKVANLLVTLPQRTRPAPPCCAKVIVEQVRILDAVIRGYCYIQ